MLSLQIANRQKTLPVDRGRIKEAVRSILSDAGIENATISIAIVDDPAIATLHAQFMDDPDPTDVLSFVLDESTDHLEGEVIASADTAKTNSTQYKTTAEQELLLYIIHGTLHLVGYDDITPKKRAVMRKMEKKYLA